MERSKRIPSAARIVFPNLTFCPKFLEDMALENNPGIRLRCDTYSLVFRWKFDPGSLTSVRRANRFQTFGRRS